MIYTHVRPDLDALASAWLVRRLRGRGDAVRFVPADWPGPVPAADVAVDIGCGIKGETDPATGRVSSAFRSLLAQPEAEPVRDALVPLAELVEAQDATGRGVRALAGPLPRSVAAHCLPSLIEAARASLASDEKLFDWASAIFDGIPLQWSRRNAARAAADRAEWFGRVALVRGDAAAELFRRGARFVVYADGLNIGVVRAADETLHLGRALEPFLRDRAALDGWFFHPTGFLACHGSRKAPATSECSVEPSSLAGALAEQLDRGMPDSMSPRIRGEARTA